MNPLLIVSGTILVGSLFYNGVLKFKVNGLENDNTELVRTIDGLNRNHLALKSSIDSQNKKIDLYKVDIALKEKKLEEWKNKPVKIRYNTIYKTIPEYIDVRKEDCETTKNTIGAIRSIDFSKL